MDSEFEGHEEHINHVHRIKISRVKDTPINKGIENLFDKDILLKSGEAITIEKTSKHTLNGKEISREQERWEVKDGMKMALCEWICENGDAKSFKNFKATLQRIKKILGNYVHQ